MVLYSNYKKMEYRVTLKHFLTIRKQRVVLNGQSSSWTNVKAGVPQGSNLRPLLFSIYINDLTDSLSSNTKLFANDTSLFSIIHDSVITTTELVVILPE